MSRHSGLDLLTVLTRQHRDLQAKANELERIPPQAPGLRHAAAVTLARDLSRHRDVEKPCLHTAAAKFLTDGADLVRRDTEQWTEIQRVIEGLDSSEPGAGHLDHLVERLVALVRGHVQEQEESLFVELNKHADRADLEWLGDRVGVRAEAAPS